mgnify:FL=1
MRLDSLSKQPNRETNSNGSIVLYDFSLNNNHFYGADLTPTSSVLTSALFEYSYLSPSFDEAVTTDKIRARSYLDQDLVNETAWAAVAPVYEIPKNEIPQDDTRFSIEFSLADALNRDIVTIFAGFEEMNNVLGNPELQFSSDYPNLENLRNIYFNRISSKLNFKDFFEFFRWFDTSIGTFIEQLIPKKTKFKGTNFTIESHMLERFKIQYFTEEQYLVENTRTRINNTLLLQQISGIIRKY